MAEVTRTIHVKVSTFDPAQGQMIPVPNAALLIEDSGWLVDPNLSSGSPTTNVEGLAQVQITFDDTAENTLNPFVTITIPEANRAVPATAPADRQITLPHEWVTRHYVRRRIPRITEHTDPNHPLQVFVGLRADLRVAYTDFHTSGLRNPLALPEDTARVHLADFDTFLWIDFLNPDDTLEGFGFNRRTAKTIPIGDDEKYPYFDTWPTAPVAFDGLPGAPQAWLDPPGMPVGRLGGGSFAQTGSLAVDAHGFVFMIDGDVVRRFYPDGTLCETIGGPGTAITLNAPQGLALDQYRHLFIADTGNNRIVICEPDWLDAGSGRYIWVRDFGSSGTVAGQFAQPRGLAVVPQRVVDGEELLAVADTGNQRVQVFRITIASPTEAIRTRRLHNPTLVPLTAFGAPASGSSATATTPVAAALWEPVGVAADRQRRLFVCDRTWHRVSRWAPDNAAAPTAYGHQVDWEKSGGLSGNGNGEFNTPEAIAVDVKNQYIYVAESGNQRVQRLDADSGNHLVHWTHTYAPALPNPFTPHAVATDARGEVFVADSANQRVLRGTSFDGTGATLPDALRPEVVGVPWTARTEPEHMRAPAYVSFGPDGKLWVSDTGNNRVVIFAADATGALVRAASQISDPFNTPVGVVVGPENQVFVVDAGNNRIRRFDAALAHQADFGAAGSGPAQFDQPRGIAIVQRVEPLLLIADRGNNRVQIVQRDGSFVKELTTAGGVALAAPEDVAVDARGNIYIADTGNARIVQFDASDNFVRAITVASHGLSFNAPCGVSIDAENKLMVTDRSQNMVFRVEADGTLLAFWDLQGLLLQDVAGGRQYYPDLARLLRFASPSRAVVNTQGLLAVADTEHDRVRLARVHTTIQVNLFDLGEGLPDISFRVFTKADWRSELGLRLNVGDVSIFDDSHDFISEPEDDFSLDQYEHRQVLGLARSTNTAINVMKVVRMGQRWYQHHTRMDDAEHRWGTPATSRELNVDLISGDNSYQFLDVNLGDDSHHGRGSDAWDDSVLIHEMTHWVFFKALEPYPPFSLSGLLGLIRSHPRGVLLSFNQALTEGWAEYVEHFWGSEFGSTDRIRGFRMAASGLTDVRERDSTTREYLFGGPTSAAPTFNAPERGLHSDDYFANALYQLHRALTDPEVVFADASAYWHRYNVHISNAQSQRFADTIWKALRRFESDPPLTDIDQGSRVYLRQVLAQFHTALPELTQMAQSIFELNNQLMPTITVTEGTSETAPGTAVGATITLPTSQVKALIVRVTDATGQPLRNYNLNFQVGALGTYTFSSTGSSPAVRHGRVPSTGMNRATNDHGIVNITFESVVAGTSPLEVSYQPDFDTDATFAPPEKGDDRETTLRQLYLYELRAVAKTWSGSGNNFGARVTRSITFNVQ
jgi:DNA-binding beta-propeller fold protein YncE